MKNFILLLIVISVSVVKAASENRTIVTDYGQALVYYTYIDEETNQPSIMGTWYIASYGDLKDEWTDNNQIRICMEIGENNTSSEKTRD